MSKDMQQFLAIPRKTPECRSASERVLDYDEIYEKFTEVAGREQSSRCEQCGNPGCEYACPLGNHIVDWLRLSSDGKLADAAIVSQSTNTFPEICGRICPQDRLCEMNCILNLTGEGAVTIGAIEAWINDWAKENNIRYQPEMAKPNGIKVAVIGAGPGGLACADMLNQLGYDVTVYERAALPGGLMTFGIPNFKLDKKIVLDRVKQLQESGIKMILQKELGRDFTVEELKNDGFKIIYLAFGSYRARPLKISGANSRFVHKALPFLIQTNEMNLKLPSLHSDSTIDVAGKKVVVLGGGDTAMDCVRTSIRKGAKSVTCVYRRDRHNMPGSQKEVTNAHQEGVKFEFLSEASEIEETPSGAIVTLKRMRLGRADATGRREVIDSGESFTIEADVILVAYGFDVERNLALENTGLKTLPDGRIWVDAQGMTSVSGIFAGGDCVRGASLVVWAIRDGREGAQAIDRWAKANLTLKQTA